MLPYLIRAATLTLLLFEMARASAPPRRPLWLSVVLGAPFVIVAALSIFVAAQAPRGRKPFSIDFSVAREDLARSMTKIPHLRSIAVIFLLAVLAFGTRRLILAFAMTMLVGVGWELADTTVIGHYARLADLAPNFVSGILSLAAIAGIRWIFEARQRRYGLDQG